MINMPLFKCLLAALSVLSCVGAVAPSTTPEVAFDVTAKMDPDMRRGRALGATPSPSPKEEEVSLWIDWQSIYQDNEAEKLKGVASLIRYATLCQYMLVPTEEAEFWDTSAAQYPDGIPGYGSRGWW